MTTYIVTATPPTPNGDFHVGHFSGPYLGGDIFARFQRLQGSEVAYVSSADRNQSYVVTTSERLRVDPDMLARNSHADMVQTLAAGDIEMDVFNPVDDRHIRKVQDFMRRIEARGYVARKKIRVPYDTDADRYLFESFLSGHCPTCWAPTAGAICETCGHPNDFNTLHLPKAGKEDSAIEFRELTIAVLELERFRDDLVAYYESKRGVWRPHLIELVDELLQGPLPDYPLTYPSNWGIPTPFEGLDGQVLNVWAEMLPGLINSTELVTGPGSWTADADSRLVQFLGYDNSFFFAVVHPALAWAHGDCILPDTIITNEFFELDNFKFSTSKGHLIWARHLMAEADVSAARFFLALVNPETQKMNFTRTAMDTLTKVRLTDPFAKAVETIETAAAELGLLDETLILTKPEAREVTRILDRFAAFHGEKRFSPQRIAEHLSHLLARIAAGAEHAVKSDDVGALRWSMAAFAIVLPAASAALMPAFSDKLCLSLGRAPITAWPKVAQGTCLHIGAEALTAAARIFDVPAIRKLERAT